ncbi:MAG TPA: hypothetical protein VFC26_11565 [Verrucomicrobiae bacterium]|nr:hypothetical protein [Verrucomicrobiae bacterium]
MAELKAEAMKLSREEQAELAAFLAGSLRRESDARKDQARLADDGDPNFTDPRDEKARTNRL